MQYALELTATAKADLSEIFTYIKTAFLDADTARSQVMRIKDTIMGLEQLPERFPLIPRETMGDCDIRKVLVDNYIVFYQIQPQPPIVYVLRVVYCRRNWGTLLQDNNT